MIEKKPKGVHFSPKRTKGVHFCYPHFVRKRLIPQIYVRTQANDNNRNKYVTLEGFAKLCEENPLQGAIMCRNIDEMEGGCWLKFVTKTCSDYAR